MLTKLKNHIMWTNPVHLIGPSCYLRELFNCDSCSNIITAKVSVTLNHWKFYLTSCNDLDIVLSIISTLTDAMLNKNKIK